SFLFGTSIAGFQVDMGCPTIAQDACDDRASDWYAWSTTPEIRNSPLLFMSKEPPEHGPGFFELYDQDIARAKTELHNGALRLSLEWSRVFPASTFGIDGQDALRAHASRDALAYYHRIFTSLRAYGMVPVVTVHHYTLPTWIHDGIACHEDL